MCAQLSYIWQNIMVLSVKCLHWHTSSTSGANVSFRVPGSHSTTYLMFGLLGGSATMTASTIPSNLHIISRVCEVAVAVSAIILIFLGWGSNFTKMTKFSLKNFIPALFIMSKLYYSSQYIIFYRSLRHLSWDWLFWHSYRKIGAKLVVTNALDQWETLVFLLHLHQRPIRT